MSGTGAGAGTGVGVWWIGEGPGDPALLEEIRDVAEREFETNAAIVGRSERPGTVALDAYRGQHLASRLLDWLDQHRAPFERLLGLTDVDLFIPILTHVYGEARFGGTVAVASTARMDGGVAPVARVVRARTLKEAIHELGHTFHLAHCPDQRCVMSRAPGLRQLDTKNARLCADCRHQVEEGLR